MVGGAVVTDDYARQIGADVYARDAVAAAKAARELVVHKKDRPNTKGVSG
jgi:5-methyltetrahydrofolate--homocysteine methyltransferase